MPDLTQPSQIINEKLSVDRSVLRNLQKLTKVEKATGVKKSITRMYVFIQLTQGQFF